MSWQCSHNDQTHLIDVTTWLNSVWKSSQLSLSRLWKFQICPFYTFYPSQFGEYRLDGFDSWDILSVWAVGDVCSILKIRISWNWKIGRFQFGRGVDYEEPIKKEFIKVEWAEIWFSDFSDEGGGGERVKIFIFDGKENLFPNDRENFHP